MTPYQHKTICARAHTGMNLSERLKQQSRDNMVNFYRRELNQILLGQRAKMLLSRHVRKRLIDYRVLVKKFSPGVSGRSYFVTPLGKKLLMECNF